MGLYGGWIRGLTPSAWATFLGAIAFVGALLAALVVTLGGYMWLTAAVVALAFAQFINLSARLRIATALSHPRAFVLLAAATGHNPTLDGFKNVIANEWAIDQTGKPANVTVAQSGPSSTVSIEGNTLSLPLDSETSLTVTSDVPLFFKHDVSFWTDIWAVWQAHVTETRSGR